MERADQILKEIDDLLAESELELIDVQTVGSSRGLVIRVFVDKPGGVSVEDCARVSRAVGDHLETSKAILGKYVLEVSSPGVDRPLRRPQDFEQFDGEEIRVSTYEKIDGRRKHDGILAGFDAKAGSVLVRDETGEPIAIPLGAIKNAHLRRDPWTVGNANTAKRKK